MRREATAALMCIAVVAVCAPAQNPNPPVMTNPTASRPPTQEPVQKPIDLPTAIRLGATSNLDITHAREVLAQAHAAKIRAYSRTLPNLGVGATYVNHNGRIQQANGNILNVNRTSLFVGGGPTLSLDFADAVFLPLAARQAEFATQAATARITNDTLYAIADTYALVLRAHRRIERSDLTLAFLTSDGASPLRGGSKGLLPLVKDVVEVGGKDALRADLARVRVEVSRRTEERAVLVQDLRFASAELARVLRLDPRIELGPVEDRWAAVPLRGFESLLTDREFLIGLALNTRPELAEARAYVQLFLERERGARYRPFLPQVQLGYAAGGFGGGPIRDTRSNIIQDINGSINRPISGTSDIRRFGPRNDLSISMGWQLQGFGVGNRAELREAQSQHNQAQIRFLATFERVAAQVVQAESALAQASERLWVVWESIADKNGKLAGPVFESVRLNFERIRGGEGRPLEALDSIRGMNDVLDAYANALSDYDRARFRLLSVLGLPPAALFDPALIPTGSPRAVAPGGFPQ